MGISPASAPLPLTPFLPCGRVQVSYTTTTYSFKESVLDTSKRLTVTSDEALKLVEEAATSQKAKYDDKMAREASEQARRVHERAETKTGREASELARERARAQHFGESFRVPRSWRFAVVCLRSALAKTAALTALLHAHLHISAMSSKRRIDSTGIVPNRFCQHC